MYCKKIILVIYKNLISDTAIQISDPYGSYGLTIRKKIIRIDNPYPYEPYGLSIYMIWRNKKQRMKGDTHDGSTWWNGRMQVDYDRREGQTLDTTGREKRHQWHGWLVWEEMVYLIFKWKVFWSFYYTY